MVSRSQARTRRSSAARSAPGQLQAAAARPGRPTAAGPGCPRRSRWTWRAGTGTGAGRPPSARHPEHRVPAGGEEHRDRQPRRPGRLDHHLQPRPPARPGQRRRSITGQARHASARTAAGTPPARPRPAPAPCAPTRSPGRSRPAVAALHPAPSSATGSTPAARAGGDASRPRSQGGRARRRLPLMCCNRARPRRAGPLPSSGASVARPAVAISRTRLSLRPPLDATHRTNRDAHATLEPRADQVPELLT